MHLTSINLTDRTETTTHAVLLAEEIMAQTLTQPLPNLKTTSGSEQRGSRQFQWRTEITDVPASSLTAAPADNKTISIPSYTNSWDQNHLATLRRVRVDVNWKDGSRPQQIYLTTYITDRNSP